MAITKLTLAKTVAKILNKFLNLLGKRRAIQIKSLLSEELAPICNIPTQHGILSFFCSGLLPLMRAETLLTKEPETIRWIDSFPPGSILWDIGANVGVYSLYAALRSDIQVIAFEPSSMNYFLLNRNIQLNRMSDRVTALCLALNDLPGVGYLNMISTELGGALHEFGERQTHLSYAGESASVGFHQAMIGFSVDSFIAQFSVPFPTHIKLDVDGIEDKIIQGMETTLLDQRLKSILIELDIAQSDYCERVSHALLVAGFGLQERSHSEMFDEGRFSSVYNHIFNRL